MCLLRSIPAEISPNVQKWSFDRNNFKDYFCTLLNSSNQNNQILTEVTLVYSFQSKDQVCAKDNSEF